MLQYGGAGGTDLLREITGCQAVALHIFAVYGAQLLLGELGREQALHQRKTDALLEGAYHNEIGKVDAVVTLFDGAGHNTVPHIVIDRRRRNRFLVLEFGRQVIEITAQQRDDLFHVKPNIRDLLPGGQTVTVQVAIPTAQLAGNQFLIVAHTNAPLSAGYYSIGSIGLQEQTVNNVTILLELLDLIHKVV